MASLNTIISWFKRSQYPTEEQFTQTWQSFRHKDELVPVAEINGLNEIVQALNNSIAALADKYRSGSVNVTDAGIDIVFETPYAQGSTYMINRQCTNAAGEAVGYTITNKTINGFRVTPVEAAVFEYECIKL